MWRVEFQEFRAALSPLQAEQREALILVGASGFSYEEAADICECAVGTINSRVNRARSRLAKLFEVDNITEMAQCLIEVCNNEELLKRTCSSTQQDVIDHFNWVNLCGKIKNLIGSVQKYHALPSLSKWQTENNQ